MRILGAAFALLVLSGCAEYRARQQAKPRACALPAWWLSLISPLVTGSPRSKKDDRPGVGWVRSRVKFEERIAAQKARLETSRPSPARTGAVRAAKKDQTVSCRYSHV
jgi:hypothetical protein